MLRKVHIPTLSVHFPRLGLNTNSDLIKRNIGTNIIPTSPPLYLCDCSMYRRTCKSCNKTNIRHLRRVQNNEVVIRLLLLIDAW